jgi:hypothetical protein
VPKPMAPRTDVLQSRDVVQIMHIQAEIESLRELEKRKAISKGEADDQVKQRQRAQVLLFQKGLARTVPVLNGDEKKSAQKQMDDIIKSTKDRKTALNKDVKAAEQAAVDAQNAAEAAKAAGDARVQEEKTAEHAQKSAEAAYLKAKLKHVETELTMLDKANDMLQKMDS